MPESKIDALLEKLELVEQTEAGAWKALCPAHPDVNPSLGVKLTDDDRILLHCFAGCKYGDILQALGIHSSDLNPELGCSLDAYCDAKRLDKEMLLRLGVSEYVGQNDLPGLLIPYYGPDNSQVWKRLRVSLNGKDKFRSPKGSKPSLYGLWHLAGDMADSVILVEGESDCHTLWQHKHTAVGVPGASTWTDDWAALFRDKDIIYVIIEPDKGGDTLRQALNESVLSQKVRFVKLPDGFKDVSSMHIDDPDRFEERLNSVLAQHTLISLGMMAASSPPVPRKYLIEGAVPERCISALFGAGDVGKSYLAMYTGICVASGTPWFGREVQQGNVLYADAELDANEMCTRAIQVAKGMGIEPPMNLFYQRLKGGIIGRLDELEKLKKQYNLSLIIVDSLTIALNAMAVNDSKEVIPAMELIEERLGTVLTLDHTPKGIPGQDQSTLTQFGSVFKRNMSRSTFRLTGDNGAVIVHHDKHNFGVKLDTFGYVPVWGPDNESVTLVPKEIHSAEMRAARAVMSVPTLVLSHVAEKGTAFRMDILKEFPIEKRASVDNALRALCDQNKLRRLGKGGYILAGEAPPPEEESVDARWNEAEEEAGRELSPFMRQTFAAIA